MLEFERQPQLVKEKITPEAQPLAGYINYFDKNWYREGLPRNWYQIDDVGFSLKGQMGVLTNPNYPITVRADQTGRDLAGFALEYLRQGLVFPFEYHIKGQELVDKKYGEKKLLDTVKPEERNGAVLMSLSRMQKHLIENPNSAAIMISPLGKTGMTADNGKAIIHQDTQIYHMERQGDKVIGTTLRTDFDLEKAKDLINILTGQKLPSSASAADCVRAIALLGKDTTLNKVENLVGVLEQMSPQFAYKGKTWTDMRNDLLRRQKLYEFDEAAKQMIVDFKTYYTSRLLTDLETQKALVATFLRVSKYFVEQNIRRVYGISSASTIHITQGQILEEVRQLPGCAGGGCNVTSTESITNRVSTFGEQTTLSCKCRFCGEQVEAIITNGKIYCPRKECGKSAPWPPKPN